MKIGLIDVDGHNFPNLALMKISAYHKRKEDEVEWALPMFHYDRVYQSKVFDNTYSQDIEWIPNATEVIKGGTGYDMSNRLPDEIEHIMPDYSLYGIKDMAYGYLTRGCPRHCGFCLVGDKEGPRSVKVADLAEFWSGQRYIKLLDPNLLACKAHLDLLQQLVESKAYVDFTQGLDIRLTTDTSVGLLNAMRIKDIHFAWDNPKDKLEMYFERYARLARHKPHGKYGTVYVLINWASTQEEDLYRVYTLRDMGFDPYIQIYDKPHAPREKRLLQRYVNNRKIFRTVPRFEDYDERK